ncbi:MAG: hypothetical protein R6U96_07685 [Promethearchaeia archaeon]
MIFQLVKDDWGSQFATLESAVWFFITYLIMLVVMTIFILLALKFVSSKHGEEGFGQVFVTSLIIVILIAIIGLFIGGWLHLLVTIFIIWLVIYARHTRTFGGAIIVSIVAIILYVIVILIIEFLFGVTIIGLSL